MTVYGRFNKENKTLEVKSEGTWSTWKWETFCKAKDKREAKASFYNDYVLCGHIRSHAIFEE